MSTGHFTMKKWVNVVHTLDQANPGCEFYTAVIGRQMETNKKCQTVCNVSISDDEKFRGSAAVTV